MMGLVKQINCFYLFFLDLGELRHEYGVIFPIQVGQGAQMAFTESVKTCFAKYATFRGRASRSEYWWFQLCFLIYYCGFMIAKYVLTRGSHLGILESIVLLVISLAQLALCIPAISAAVRRLHDTDRSGWWYWLCLIPLIGIILLAWFCSKGTDGDNEYGTNPLATTDSSNMQPEVIG
jgi:uncharacterized membrane protein YhaH (DUF805 family)